MDARHIAYIVKRYPRYSETFVVREILAHEAAGIQVHIFALRSSNDTHFQNAISLVRAGVTYLPAEDVSANQFWLAYEQARQCIPHFSERTNLITGEDGRAVYQSLLLAQEASQRGISHLHAPFAHKGATVARLASLLTGIPFSFTARAKDVFPLEVQPEDLKRKLRDASAVITISDYHVKYLRERYGPVADRVRRIYNGLDLEIYSYHNPQHRLPVLLSVGRLVEKKGFEDLIKACSLLSEQGVEFTCRIIGEGYLEGVLRDEIRKLDLESKVDLLGPRPELEVIDLMQAASVFVLPCVVSEDHDQDGLPNVIFESMALGTPCVSTDVAGIPEVVHNEKTGLLVPQRNPAALAEALRRLLSDPALRVQLSRQARDLIEREFDIRKNAAERRKLFWPALESVETIS